MQQQQLGDFAPTLNPELSQYHTPPRLARRMVEWAGVKDKRVLEPSAGGGNLVREIFSQGAKWVTAIEIDKAWYATLSSTFGAPGTIQHGDFLTAAPAKFDIAVANPPLDGGVGPDHVARMLEWAPKVVSLLRVNDLVGKHHHEVLWSQCDLEAIAFLVKRPRFTGDGGVADFCVVEVCRLGEGAPNEIGVNVDHWTDDWSKP